MADLELIFKTKAELQGAQQVLAATEREIGAAKALGQAYDHLEVKASAVREAIAKHTAAAGQGSMWGGLMDELRDVVPGLDKAATMVSKLSSGPLGAMAAGLTVAAGALSAVKTGLDEYAEAQERVAQLQAALAQSGQLTDDYNEALQALAGEMQKATAIADDQWIAVSTRLTQFGADNSNIRDYTDAVKNLAGLMGGDVQSAASVFSRALQGNFEAFSRYGISVEDAGTQTEKLEKLMQQLAFRGGGQLEASANTLNGQFRALKNNTSDLFEAIGRGIAGTGVLQTGLQGLADAAEWWAEKLGGPIKRLEGLQNASSRTAQALMDDKTAFEAFTKAMENMAFAADQTTKGFDHQLQKAQLLKTNIDRLAEAQKKLALAEIDRQVIQGAMSPAQGLMAKAGIDEKFAKEAAAREQSVLLAESIRNQSVVNQAAFESLTAKQRVEAKQKEMAGKTPDQETVRVASLFRQLEEAEQELARLKEESKAGGEVGQGLMGLVPGGRAVVAGRQAQAVGEMGPVQDRIEKLKMLLGGASKPEETAAVKSAMENQRELETLRKDAAEKERRLKEAEAAYLRSQELLNLRKQGAGDITDAEQAAAKAQAENQQIRAQKEEEEKRQRENERRVQEYERRRKEGDPNAADAFKGASAEFEQVGKDLASILGDGMDVNIETVVMLVELAESFKAKIDDLNERVNNLRLS